MPTLARFVSATSTPRALVIDGNAERASQVSGFLKALGFAPSPLQALERRLNG